MSIQELAEVVGGRMRLSDLPPLGGAWEPIGRIVVDPQRIQPGDVLLALPDAVRENPCCAEQAFDRGALGAIAAGRPVEPWAGRFSIHVDDAQWALWQLARSARQRFDGQVVAVAGRVGKTTAAAMIAAVLEIPSGESESPARPGKDAVLTQMLSLDEDQPSYAVCELHASDVGDIDAAAHLCCPHVGVVTATADGGDDCCSEDRHVYQELLSALPDGGWVVMSGDRWPQMSGIPGDVRAMTFGRGSHCDVTATHILCEDGRLSFIVDGQRARLPVWGRHLLRPALSAWCVGRVTGVDEATIARRLANCALPPRRCQVTRAGQVTVIDDTYKTTPGSAAAALRLVQSINVPGRRIAVCGRLQGDRNAPGGATSSAYVRWGSDAVTVGGVDLLFAVGDHGDEIAKGARRQGMPAHACVRCETTAHTLEALQLHVASGDAVLLAGVENQMADDLVAMQSHGREPLRAAA